MSARATPSFSDDRDLDMFLDAWLAGVRAALGEQCVGVYLHGSLGVGDFDAHADLDFLVAVRDELSWTELAALERLHEALHASPSPWARQLDGSYVPLAILRKYDPAHTELPYLDRGSRHLIASDHCNQAVVRWMVRERGIPLAGPDPRELIDPVSASHLSEQAVNHMRLWTDELEADPSAMNNRWYQPYAVLSYCRMLYTIERGSVVSKPVAARWALATLGAEWHDLIVRAATTREDPAGRARTSADPADLAETRRFIQAVVRRVTERAGAAPAR